MAIYKDRHCGKFVQMHNSTACSTTLSLRAKGLLITLLSYPETWKFNVKSLARDCKESITADRNTLNELIKAGHVHCKRIRTQSGQFEYVFDVYETPRPENENI
ncbi:MAG: helix-turn-helix domain-containing protein [Ruminococcus sp.]|nr:helix-turn-helix domain-containing protein [Ruminococcus sp.]